MNVAVIVVAGSAKQNTHFWPTYNMCTPGLAHDLIVVHRNMQFVPKNQVNNYGAFILENKVKNDGSELPHKAFGAYREYWSKYKDNYDYFAFISDDVLIKRDEWLLHPMHMLFTHLNLGLVGSQIFNGMNGEYPHQSHCRAPIWFASSRALKKINWKFKSDHDGEMRIADQMLEAGYFSAQAGNKIDLAYDSLENGGHFDGDHISSIMSKQLGIGIWTKPAKEELDKVNQKLLGMLERGDDTIVVSSPFKHIGKRKLVSQLQPFDGLIYDKGIDIAIKNGAIKHRYGIVTI